MKRLMLLAGLASGLMACASQPVDPCSQGACHMASTVEPLVPRLPHASACERLAPTAADCCVLACTDPAAFRAECAPPPGRCVEFACPLDGGGSIHPGLCTAPPPPERATPPRSSSL